MAQNPEAKFKNKVHRYLDPSIYHQGMYTPYSCGTPDHWYSGVEDDLWIEYKWDNKVPKTIYLCNPNIKYPKITLKQQSWLRGRYSEGRNIVVVYATPDGATILQSRAWEHQFSRETFFARATEPKLIARWITYKVSIKKYLSPVKEVIPI